MADGAAPRKPATADDFSVERLRKQYLGFAADKDAELREQKTARHYYHGDQYTKDEIATLRARNQPAIFENRIQRKIDGIVGFLERLKQDPKAYPRTPQEQPNADLATAVIRYVLDDSQWNDKRPNACRNGGVNGLAGVELDIVRGDRGDPDIGLNLVDPDTFFYDQRSVQADFSDARFMGTAKWVDVDVAKGLFPAMATEIDDLVSGGSPDGGMALSPQTDDAATRWINSTEKQLFLVEHWYIVGGSWRWCFYCANLMLKRGASPYRDEKGRTKSRYIMFSANVDHDGDRYGFIRNMKPLQDEVNARRSKALHLMHTRRVIAEKGAVTDVEVARHESVRPDGYIEVNPGKRFDFDDVSKAQEWDAQVALLKESTASIESFGPNPALIGQGVDNKSGRAIQLLQQAGLADLGPFMQAWKGWKLRVYRAVWNAVRQFWTAERWVRVTDSQNAVQFIRINGLGIGRTGVPAMINQLGALDVDIILDEGPDTINLMQDTFDALTSLAGSGAPVPPSVIIEMSPALDSDTKKRILQQLRQASQPNPLAERGAAAKVAVDEAKAKETETKALKNLADAHASAQPAPVVATPQQPKPPSVSINFKDMPPEAQAQALAEAGIFIPAPVLAIHAAEQRAAKTAPQPAA